LLSGNSKSFQGCDERSAILFGQIQSEEMTFDRIALGAIRLEPCWQIVVFQAFGIELIFDTSRALLPL
jgi:hypothetical protein